MSKLLGKNTDAHVLVDISCGREICRVTSDVLAIWILVHTNIINLHGRRELKIVEVWPLESFGHTQVHDDVLNRTGQKERVTIPTVSVPWVPEAQVEH